MRRPSRRAERRRSRGFALVDLAVLIGCVALLAALLLPALARAAKGGQAAICLNNLRQMSRACLVYTSDNGERFPGALHGGTAASPVRNMREAPWATGWLDWTTNPANTNTLYLIDPGYASLATYVDRDPHVFKCPADEFASAAQMRRGWSARVRSISGNIGIGDGNAEQGPWDIVSLAHVRKTYELRYPAPEETWLYLDEHPDSLNDPAFFTPNATSWIDLPASYHNGAAGIAFVSGRAALHKWRGSTVSPVRMGTFLNPMPPQSSDLRWLREHSPRRNPAP